MDYNKYLREKMVPAFGCTEPIALAFAASRARFILGEDPERITARLSGNIIKNVNSVKVPGTDGRKGIEISLAAGAFLGDYTKKLEVLSDVDKSKLEYLDDLIKEGLCDIELLHEKKGLYIDVSMEKGEKTSRVVIKDFHTNIIFESLNDEILFEKKEDHEEVEGKVDLSFDKIYDFAKNGNYDDIIDVLDKELSTTTPLPRRESKILGVQILARWSLKKQVISILKNLCLTQLQGQMPVCLAVKSLLS